MRYKFPTETPSTSWIIGLLSLGVGIGVTAVMKFSGEPIKFIDYVQALSAAGTLAAVLVALHFSSQAAREGARQQRQRALIAAARLTPHLERMLLRCKGMIGLFVQRDLLDHERTLESDLAVRGEIESALATLPEFPTLLVPDIAALPDHAAARTANAVGIFEALIADVAATHKSDEWTTEVPDAAQFKSHRGRTLEFWTEELWAAHLQLEKAMAACGKSSSNLYLTNPPHDP